jgi:hypothetical protein
MCQGEQEVVEDLLNAVHVIVHCVVVCSWRHSSTSNGLE